MRKTYLLDCTLRDGGYVNNWNFGRETIKGFSEKIARTGIEMFEVGFLKGDKFNPDRTVYPDIKSIEQMISPKNKNLIYLAMLDMSAPIPLERITPCDGNSVDGIRVIFKKDKIDEAYVYCQKIQELGYKVFVNFVGTDLYTDREFIDGIEKFNKLLPYGMAIVDTFGLIKRRQFRRLVALADNNMAPSIILCYHAHNNLQQAFGNAEAMVEMNLTRNICVDACVFGMGRGAGNLNLELFADFMNENYDTSYKIEPMLEIMDEYLGDIYKSKFWGYSLPLYLSAVEKCHPNYAISLAEKDSLTVKSFGELLRGISAEDKAVFSKDKAEKYYREYQEKYIDDREAIVQLADDMKGKNIVLIAPGKSLTIFKDKILDVCKADDTRVIAVNFLADEFKPDYVFSSNMRRYNKIAGRTEAKCIITSNIKETTEADYVVNFASFALDEAEIIDNSGLMALKLLARLGVEKVAIAGMDGYSVRQDDDYYDENLKYNFREGAETRNELIDRKLASLQNTLQISFVTPSQYHTQGRE